MSTTFKNKLLMGLVIFLLVANLTTIIFLWMGMSKMHPVAAVRQPSEYLIKKLSFDETQQEQYKGMVKLHRGQTQQLRERIKESKDSLFELLGHENINDSVKNNLLGRISSLNRQLDSITFDHFSSVRKICNAGQQKKFDKIISDVLRMMSGPGPGGNMPPPHEAPGSMPEGPPPPPPAE